MIKRSPMHPMAWMLILSIVNCPAILEAAEKPNVVILFADDLGTLDVGCFGSDDLVTPNIDALAEARVCGRARVQRAERIGAPRS